MRLLLFGGFLGSGKTSTILEVAKQITEVQAETVAIIENEIGEAGVDDKLLKTSGIEVRPLFGGCVCCQITSDLVTAVAEIHKTINPDWLIIEMTGIAVPSKVADFIGKYHLISSIKTITIVDAGRWPELLAVLEPLMESQIAKSDLVIINKIDLAGFELSDTIESVKKIAGSVPLLTACALNKLPPKVLAEVLRA
ncbi:MAG: yjiA 1 [Firmicutes bacterium]|nr:yjiA 1 [Bacillota bacterium]